MSELKLPARLQSRAHELGHAYILCDGGQSALEEAARGVAAAMICGEEHRPCGVCKHCRKAAKDIHPDIIWVDPPDPGKDYKVDDVRDLRSDAYIRPNEASRKVYIFRYGRLLNPKDQDALLKVIEEGPAYAAFLILLDNDAALLPTIRSRCETVRLMGAFESDQTLERRGGELAGLLLGEDKWGLITWCAPYEKGDREEVLALLEAARRALLVYRTPKTTAKAARLALALEEIITAGNRNMNLGTLWGWVLALGA